MLSAETITRGEFDSALARYPALIKVISDSKKSDHGHPFYGVSFANETKETLEQLDEFRFKTAPERYSSKGKDGKPVPLEHEDVVKLVTWKLKHGKFRPNLLKLSSSNSASLIASTSLSAFTSYTSSKSPSLSAGALPALKVLATLSGIGPATASLLLAVHDPAHIVFFGDEVFRWICCGGRNDVIKYSLKEYESLLQGSEGLMERLGVEAWEVEMVGFVLGREGEGAGGKEVVGGRAKEEKDEKDVVVEARTTGGLKKTNVSRGSSKDKNPTKKVAGGQKPVEKRKMAQEEHSTVADRAKRLKGRTQ